MSLLPMRNLSGSLPILFIEARLQGPPEIMLSQMGISVDADNYNIALLIRTSGVLLVASVGSYVMYRVCTRLLGKNFIWTILEQARFDLLARNETYLLNSRMSYAMNDKYDSCCLAEVIGDKECDPSNHTLATVPSSACFFDHLRRTRLLYEGSTESSRKRSEITSKHVRHSTNLTSQSSSNEDFTSSEKSASLHLLWDDPQWDEETDFCFYGNIVYPGEHSASSDVSDMTEFRAAKELFEDSNDYCRINREDQKNHENSSREGRSIDLDTNDFIQKSCMVDSKHLYQITSGFITRTNSISISSERSSQSFLSLRQRLVTNPPSGGLLELIQSSTTSPIISADHLMTSMTDSGISKGTNSTYNLQSSIRSTDAKCNFGAEIFSSEDGALDMMMPFTLTANKNSVIGRNNLNLINDERCSTAASAQSVDWFEDNYCPFATSEELGEPLEIEIDDPLAACFSGSSYNQICSINSENRQKHLYEVTRDLMAWARDQFAPKSLQLKALQSLYISHQCWRKIGLKRSSNCSEQFLNSLLHLMFIRGIPFFSCSNVLIIIKAVRRAFSRYEFVQQWSFSHGFTGMKNKEEYAISLLQNLWDLQQGVKYLEGENVERRCIEAIRLLVLLWIVHCFEKMEAGQWQNCPTFYAELFGNSNPRQIMQNLYKADLNSIEMTLLTDALRIRLELLDCSCGDLDVERPDLPRSLIPQDRKREITSRPILTFLKFNRHNFLYPLYHGSK